MSVVPFQMSHGCLDEGVPFQGAPCRLNLETPSHICRVMRFRMEDRAELLPRWVKHAQMYLA